MKVYPSILSGDHQKVQEQLGLAQGFAGCTVVQIDVLDGIFADNLTLSPFDFAGHDFGNLKLDFHLMIEEPLDAVYELKDVKSYLPVRAVIGQVEKMSHQAHFLEEVKKEEWLPGLSLNLHTPLEAVDENSWEMVKVVQLMSIEAGFQGQQFVPMTLEKIEELAALRLDKSLQFEILVDGGVKPELIDELKAVGADGVAVGSAIWQEKNQQSVYKKLIQSDK